MPSITSSACWRLAIPPLVAAAGSSGARLHITLLRPAVVTLYGGHAFVLHDPVGLTGDRLLAALHAAAEQHPAASGSPVRWVLVQPPLASVWSAMHALDWRAVWRHRRSRWGSAPPTRPARVAETYRAQGGPPTADRVSPPEAPRILLVSESERGDALATEAAARLLARALRESWALFTVTRQSVGPARDAGADPLADDPTSPPLWRTHLVCRAGRLQPVEAPPRITRLAPGLS
jgi:hypothetical protein